MNVFEKFNEMDKKTKIIIVCMLLVVLVIAAVGAGLSCSGDSSVDNKVVADNGNKNIVDNQGNEESKTNTKKPEKTGDAKEDESQNEISSEKETKSDKETDSDKENGSSEKASSDNLSSDKETDKSDTSSLTEENDNPSEESTTSTSTNTSTNEGDNIIRLNGNSISYGGTGAVINGSEVTITAAGDYYVTGTLNDGRIIVNADSDADITINLMGVDISNTDSCCIYVISADKVVLNLNDGTSNVISDGKTYVYDDATEEEPNAAIFSKDDLVIEGNGKLTINGNFNNGIASKDDLRIKGGTVVVTAVNNGLKGKDAIELSDANVTVNSGGDALKADNTEAGMGGIYIESGTYNLTASEDGMQAESEIIINGGTFTIKTGNGSNSSGASSDVSMKGIKATGNILINDGTFNINSQDDSIHANTNVTIAGGTFTMASADDGMHADTDLTISGGNITITKSYEGIEATNIYIKGGNTSVVASDDGLNAAGGNDTSGSTGNKRPGMGNFSSSTGTITFSGGTLIVDASGDGIDSNGTVTYNSGNVTVYGPTSGGNGTLDYDGSWTQNGGNFVGIGGKDMAQMPSGGSQYSVMVNFTSSYQSGTIVTVKNSSGTTVLEVTAKKSFQNLVFSNPNLAKGEYTVYINGNQYTTFTISSTLTTVGSSGGNNRPW